MGSQLIGSGREAAIWARLIHAQPDDLAPEAAEYLLGVRFDESDRVRMEELASRSENGTLTDADREEFDSYLRVGNLLAAMHSRARQALHRA